MERKTPDDLYALLRTLGIPFKLHFHPPAPTIALAMEYWKNIPTAHCKNLFFRNHKGNRHYLVIIEHLHDLAVHDLEKRLKQGKLTFASPERMRKHLGVEPGSVTPFGIINDTQKQVHLFIDESLQKAESVSFHPLVNTASLSLRFADFIHFLEWSGNSYEFISMQTIQP